MEEKSLNHIKSTFLPILLKKKTKKINNFIYFFLKKTVPGVLRVFT